MKKIVLVCVKNYDAFACEVAKDIQQVADDAGIEIECSSMTAAELHRLPTDTDLVLFAPPRYRHLDRIKKFCPNAKIDMIDLKAYALRDGKGIFKFALQLLET